MKDKTLINGSLAAVCIIAVVLYVGMVTGFSGVKPFISVDPVSDKNIGEQFTIRGTTNLPEGSEIIVDIHPSSLDLNTGMVTDPKTGAAMHLDSAMVVTGMIKVDKNPDGVAAWSFDVPSTTFLKGKYTAIVFAYNKDEPAPGSISGVANFTVRPGTVSAVTGQFIRIDPVGDKNVGDRFNVTGTTNLPAGTEILFQAYAASYEPSATNPQTDAQQGEFVGATGIVKVTPGIGKVNSWSADLDLSTFLPKEYLVNVSVFTGDVSKGDFSTGSPFGKTTFTVHPSSGTAGTSRLFDNVAAGGILIDAIRDTTAGDLLVVTGKTNLSVGTDLLVKVIPASMDNETIIRNYQNPENAAVIKVVKGSGINNRFSVPIDTRFFPPAEHIVFVSDVKGNAAGIDSVPSTFTGSALFNIIAGKAGTSSPQNDIYVPHIFINPISDVTAGDSLIVSGTTNLPVGSKFRVSVIPASSTDFEHPELAATISAVKGSTTGNLFSVTLATKDLPKGEHILIVSAEDAEMTGSILFTVK